MNEERLLERGQGVQVLHADQGGAEPEEPRLVQAGEGKVGRGDVLRAGRGGGGEQTQQCVPEAGGQPLDLRPGEDVRGAGPLAPQLSPSHPGVDLEAVRALAPARPRRAAGLISQA